MVKIMDPCDVIWARKARQDHDAFVDLMREEFDIQVWRVHHRLNTQIDPEIRTRDVAIHGHHIDTCMVSG